LFYFFTCLEKNVKSSTARSTLIIITAAHFSRFGLNLCVFKSTFLLQRLEDFIRRDWNVKVSNAKWR